MKRDKRSTSFLDNWNTQTPIVMAKKKEMDVTSETYKLKVKVESKSKVAHEKWPHQI